MDNILEKFKEYEDYNEYKKEFKYYIFYFEEIIKRSRTKKKINKVQPKSQSKKYNYLIHN